jgi:Na+-driven multidrug efflux pump
MALFLNAKSILLLFGQEEQVAEVAQQYITIIIPGLLFFNMFEAVRRYLNAQLIFTVPMVVQLIALILHFFWCLLFISYYDLEIVGAAIAITVTYFLGKLNYNL